MHALKRTILVTGASSGIGRAIAKNLLQQGHFVIGTSRDCNKFIIENENFSFIEIDFSQLDTIEAIIKLLIKQYPLLDAVIFSAGYGQFGSIEQFSYHQIEQLLAVNFTSQALITSSLISSFKKKQHSNLI